MADRTIGELTAATQVYSSDLFVLEQSNTAKKLTGQILENWLVSLADGHGGIQTIAKTSTSGLVDTYTITYADTTTSTFTVTNGSKGDTGAASYVYIRYADSQPTRDADMKTTPSNWIGIYSGTASTAPTTYTNYQWFNYKGAKGDTGAGATISSQDVKYQKSNSGATIPTGEWTSSIPTLQAGDYLWTRSTVTFDSGVPQVSYSVSYLGQNGTGTGTVVGNKIGGDGTTISPDASGIVTLPIDTSPIADSNNLVTSGALFTKFGQVVASAVPRITSGNTQKLYGHNGSTQNEVDITSLQAKKVSISLTTSWAGETSPYTHIVNISGETITANTKVDLQPNSSAIAQLIEDEVQGLYVENNNGVLTAYAIGNAPSVALTIQATLSEVTS